MGADRFVSMLAERFDASAHVGKVFGEPVKVGDKTIIPVAKIACGFGGGPTASDSETQDITRTTCGGGE